MNQTIVILVAGGTGERMRSPMPKQFLPLGQDGVVLMQTLRKIRLSDKHARIILVLPTGAERIWDELCKKYQYKANVEMVEGGKSRFRSVKNALIYLKPEKIHPKTTIAIHDAVRPFFSPTLWQKLRDQCLLKGNAVPAVPITNTLRMKGFKGSSTAVNRRNYMAVQTPQLFEYAMLSEAFKQNYSRKFTDDSSVVENAGYNIHLVPGEHENFKITSPWDYHVAKLIFNHKP